jgi:ribosomal protein RSM22 (predicted rRNA methylase)
VNLPGNLGAALADWMDVHGQGSLRQTTAALAQTYRKGKTSSQIDLGAYVATRVPATFAANCAVQAALADVMPAFVPQSLLDVGTGPGVASWAAVSAWPSLATVIQCEQDDDFADLAETLNAASEVAALISAIMHKSSEAVLPLTVRADLVVASYMLAELPLDAVEDAVNRLWTRTQQVLVLIEPGTPKGFERLRRVRVANADHVIAPCTHHQACPMAGTDWCHFKTRLSRSREHMHAKRARVPFEDEAFSYLVLARPPSGLRPPPPAKLKEGIPLCSTNLLGELPKGLRARIIAPPVASKAGITLRLCAAGTVYNTTIASRDKPTYKRARRMTWGQVWE